jgi:hypothetical protein
VGVIKAKIPLFLLAINFPGGAISIILPGPETQKAAGRQPDILQKQQIIERSLR